MTNRTRVAPVTAVATFVALGALLLSGCSTSAQAHWSKSPGATGPTSAAPSATSAAAAGVSVVPASAATGVAPSTRVQVTAAGGASVTAVTVTHGSSTVSGKLAADGKSWTSTGKLGFNTKYTIKVTSSGAKDTTTTSTFTTAKATKTITSSLMANKMELLHTGTYGVGQVIVEQFHKPIPTSQRAAIEAALKVTSTPAVEGRWHWINSEQVDYRPESYWATGTKIQVDADLYGVKFAKGVYGGSSASATMTIGDSHVLIADYKTERMKVYINGKLVRTVKTSLGMGGSTTNDKGQKLNYWTRGGPHIVITKSPSTIMSSASNGLTDKNSPYYYAPEKVYDTVRISYSGEFVHLRTWSTSLLGHRNTSHGCINVGIADAPYLYKLLREGDIVDVIHSPVPISFANTQADWEIKWSQWT
ncbi:MAG TPA: Ig-like domain-containing protein [Micromonosporaceae bacterium]|jgi:lipoprotein-anchoring transpeptidase ErfK/SrfK